MGWVGAIFLGFLRELLGPWREVEGCLDLGLGCLDLGLGRLVLLHFHLRGLGGNVQEALVGGFCLLQELLEGVPGGGAVWGVRGGCS